MLQVLHALVCRHVPRGVRGVRYPAKHHRNEKSAKIKRHLIIWQEKIPRPLARDHIHNAPIPECTKYRNTNISNQAHLPSKLISTSPVTSPMPASSVVTSPVSASSAGCPCIPVIQSADHISTTPTHTRIPAEKASRMPMARSVSRSEPLNWSSTPMPMAMPMGVTSAKAPARNILCLKDIGVPFFRGLVALSDSSPELRFGEADFSTCGSRMRTSAMREPSAMPSNIWWKRMTTKSVITYWSGETTRVRPITATVRQKATSCRVRTQRVEDDARLHNHYADQLRRRVARDFRRRVSSRLSENHALAGVLNHKRHKDACHQNGRRCRLVGKLSDAFIAERQRSMGKKLTC